MYLALDRGVRGPWSVVSVLSSHAKSCGKRAQKKRSRTPGTWGDHFNRSKRNSDVIPVVLDLCLLWLLCNHFSNLVVRSVMGFLDCRLEFAWADLTAFFGLASRCRRTPDLRRCTKSACENECSSGFRTGSP